MENFWKQGAQNLQKGAGSSKKLGNGARQNQGAKRDEGAVKISKKERALKNRREQGAPSKS